MREPKHIQIFADYDGALGDIDPTGSSLLPTTVFNANEKLNRRIYKYHQDETVAKITVRCFSARNDCANDFYNAKRNANGSVFEELGKYVDELKQHTNKIHLRKTLAQDFFAHNKTTGTAPETHWKKLEQHKLQKKWQHLAGYFPFLVSGDAPNAFEKCLYPADCTKVMLFFIHVWDSHHSREPNCELNIEIYDDNMPILTKIHEFYSQNKHLLPPNMDIRFVHYEHISWPDGTLFRYKCDVLEHMHIDNKDSSHPIDVSINIQQEAVRLASILQIKRVAENEPYTITAALPVNLRLDFLAQASNDYAVFATSSLHFAAPVQQRDIQQPVVDAQHMNPNSI